MAVGESNDTTNQENLSHGGPLFSADAVDIQRFSEKRWPA
jgi:hypothetical protein